MKVKFTVAAIALLLSVSTSAFAGIMFFADENAKPLAVKAVRL